MSGSVLFDAPGPRTVARHRLYSALTLVLLAATAAAVVWKLADKDQLTYEKWEVFLTPDYLEVILVDGLLKTLQMAFFSILLAVGGLVSVVLSQMPDAFYRLLAFPNGIAMVALGWSLWSTARVTATTQPTSVQAPVTR